jgi:hypothetical protein
MQDWENLLEACDQIDSSQLLIAIKEYEAHAVVYFASVEYSLTAVCLRSLSEQGCMSPALDNECFDGWTLAASEVCFSAGGADAAGITECTTTGGNAPEGSSCAFPFVYQGTTYNSCTSDNCNPPGCGPDGNGWCSINEDYAAQSVWGNCACVTTDAHYGTFTLPIASPGLKLVHKSGGVSCNSARGFLSNWGCDLEADSQLGTFVTTDCASGCDTSHIVAPAASRAGNGWWYRPYDANW